MKRFPFLLLILLLSAAMAWGNGPAVPPSGSDTPVATVDFTGVLNYVDSSVQGVLSTLDAWVASHEVDSSTHNCTVIASSAAIPNNASFSFDALSDSPSYTGNTGKVLAVNGTEDGLEWVAQSSGGGGGGASTLVMSYSPTSFFFPLTNYPDLELSSGTYTLRPWLAFDDTTAETAWLDVPVPLDVIETGVASLNFWLTPKTYVANKTVLWEIRVLSVWPGRVGDAALTLTNSVATLNQAAAGQYTMFSVPLDLADYNLPSTCAARLEISITRVASTTDLVGDVILHGVDVLLPR